MTVSKIEKEIMKLGSMSRAKLVSKLLKSLEDLPEAENEKLWIEEAEERLEEITAGHVKSRRANLVYKNARAKLK